MTRRPALVLRQMMDDLESSQWCSAEEISATQFQQLGMLAEHCARYSRQFARRLARANLRPADLAGPRGFSQLPVLTRREVQRSAADLCCTQIPPSHEPVGEGKTSGSTGEPVVVLRTGLTRFVFLGMTMRDLLWHRTDTAGKSCAVRANVSTPTVHDDWGPPANLFGPTGRFLTLPVAADAARLVEWVREFAPSSILIYPSTLRAFIDYCRDTGIEIPSLTHIRTVGETLSLSIRTDAQAAFKAKVTDCYSSQELGYMALQCPESGLYHTMAEGILAEVLNDSGEPCAEGEIGRVTVTDLHNFATPLVRYDIGDFAEVGPRCPCGRGFPTWTRIVGRERNLVLMPDGSRHWPVTGFIRCRDVAPILQYQLVQRSRDAIDARLVVERTLSIAEEDHLRELFHSCIGYPFRLQLSYVDGRIPHGPSGKFEEFVCEVADVA